MRVLVHPSEQTRSSRSVGCGDATSSAGSSTSTTSPPQQDDRVSAPTGSSAPGAACEPRPVGCTSLNPRTQRSQMMAVIDKFLSVQTDGAGGTLIVRGETVD